MQTFDRVYCIHYPDTKRREAIEKQFAAVGIDEVEYVYAKRPTVWAKNMRRNPQIELAVNYSHIKAVVRAIADGAQCPLFVEDDIIFSEDFGVIVKAGMAALPPEWDVVYFGGHPCSEVEPVAHHLVKIGRFSFAESYAIRGPSLLAFFDFWLDRIGQLEAMYDRILGEFAEQRAGYCVYPVVTHQPLGYSHISKAKDNKAELVRRGWANNLA